MYNFTVCSFQENRIRMNFFVKHFGQSHVHQHPTFGLLVEFSTFLEVLKKASLPTDSLKYKKANVERTVNGYKNGMVILEDQERPNRTSNYPNKLKDDEKDSQKQWITSRGLLKYVFKHSSEVALCSTLADEVESIICQQGVIEQNELLQSNEQLPSHRTILDLYRSVTKLSLREEKLEAFYSNVFEADQASLPTLYSVHKHLFTDNEWQKIKHFEYHFALTHGSQPQKTVEEALEVRSKYLKVLCKATEMRDEIHTLNKKTTRLRNSRRESGNMRMQQQMKGASIHLYNCLDKQVQAEVEKYFLAVVDDIFVIPSSVSNHVTVCFNLKDNMIETGIGSLSDIHKIVSTQLMSKHSLGLDKMYVLATGTFKGYYREDLHVYARHILHDDIVIKKVKPISEYKEETAYEDENLNNGDNELPTRCENCFPLSLPKPLDMNSFALLQEWVMDVPLTIQLLLESSISMKSFKDSSDKSGFLQPRLTKLYIVYDTMLNILNRKYTGLLQEANTLELIMHSKSLDTVFQVASNAGIAMSSSSAYSYLKNNTVDDALYYNTYLQGQPLTYKRNGCQVTDDICLRECIIILMVDNLVRLKFTDDPNPGENRSKQINTLPITIQGIPRDSDEVASWHLQNCDGSPQCPCKNNTELTSSALEPLMVTLLSDEEVALKKFSKLCTWGYPGLWEEAH